MNTIYLVHYQDNTFNTYEDFMDYYKYFTTIDKAWDFIDTFVNVCFELKELYTIEFATTDELVAQLNKIFHT